MEELSFDCSPAVCAGVADHEASAGMVGAERAGVCLELGAGPVVRARVGFGAREARARPSTWGRGGGRGVRLEADCRYELGIDRARVVPVEAAVLDLLQDCAMGGSNLLPCMNACLTEEYAEVSEVPEHKGCIALVFLHDTNYADNELGDS